MLHKNKENKRAKDDDLWNYIIISTDKFTSEPQEKENCHI